MAEGQCPRARFGGLRRPDGFASAVTHDPHHNGTGTQDPSAGNCPRWRRCRTFSLAWACPAARDSGQRAGHWPYRYGAIGTIDEVLLVCRGAGGLRQGGTRQPCPSFLMAGRSRAAAPCNPRRWQDRGGGKPAEADARTRGVVGTMQPVNQQSRLASGDVRRILRSGKPHG